MRCGDDTIDWATLNATVHRLAACLAARIPPGRGLAVSLPNEPALLLLVLGAIRAGREVQILDPTWPAAITRRVLAALRPGWHVGAAAGIGDLVLPDPRPFAAVAAALGAPLAETPHPEPAPETPFYVGFTSGTTGMPKGFRRDQRSWIESFRGDQAVLPIGPADTVLALGSLMHSNFLYAFLRAVHEGAGLILPRRFSAGSAWRVLAEGQANVLYGVPTMLQVVTDVGDAPCAEVRLVYSSGAKFPPAQRPRLAARFPSARFCEYYGASETSFITITRPDEDTPPDSVGRPFPGVEVSIRDPDGARLPAGATGLVFVESPLCFLGYATGEPAVAARAGAAMSLGDVGRLDADGFLYIVGRADRMILSCGRNIHPEEVEAALQAQPGVTAAAVFGTDDDVRGTRLVAALCCDGAPPARAALSAALRLLLPGKVPHRFVVFDTWDFTAGSKTDFAVVRRRIEAGEGRILQ